MVAKAKGGAFFPVFFLLIGLAFVSILGFTYVRTRQANPVMLDEKGQIRATR